MGRGHGKIQQEILTVLSERGKWTWGRDLVTLVMAPEPGVMIPYSRYVSILRAANALVRSKELCSGFPENGVRWIEKWRAAYWLPGQTAPAIRRRYPATLIEKKVLEAIQTSSEPLSFTSVAWNLADQIKIDRYEFQRLKMPVHRAIARLADAGRIHATTVYGKRCWVTESSNETTVMTQSPDSILSG